MKKCRDIMTPDPVACRAGDDLHIATRAMERHQARRIPVVDANACLVGIIAQADIAVHAGEPAVVAEVVEEISKPA